MKYEKDASVCLFLEKSPAKRIFTIFNLCETLNPCTSSAGLCAYYDILPLIRIKESIAVKHMFSRLQIKKRSPHSLRSPSKFRMAHSGPTSNRRVNLCLPLS